MEKGNTKPKKSFIKRILILINIVFALLLILSYFAPYINPKSHWIFAFLGISYPGFLIVNLFFVAYWLLRRKWLFLISVLSILLGWNFLRSFYQYHPFNKDFSNAKALKVLSYNVRNFDLYNYNDDWSINFENRNHIFKFVDSENPDIICYQEFVVDSSGQFETIDTLVKLQKANNVHFHYTASSKRINYFGIATFSAYPIINKGFIKFDNSIHNICIYSDIAVLEDTIRVYNVHFESIHLSENDKKFANDLSKIKNLDDDKEISKNSRKILSRLKWAFIKRATQVESVFKHIKACPHPVILCGDFNDTPNSYAYHKINQLLDDAFVESGTGFGKTYTGVFPSFRIDYIFYSSHFRSYNFQVVPLNFSDHYPINCFLELKK